MTIRHELTAKERAEARRKALANLTPEERAYIADLIGSGAGELERTAADLKAMAARRPSAYFCF